jgi:hypothetical protein
MPKSNNKKSVVHGERRKRTHKKTMRGGGDGEPMSQVVLAPGEYLMGDRDSNDWGATDQRFGDMAKITYKQNAKPVGVGLIIAAGVAVGSIFLLGALKKH